MRLAGRLRRGSASERKMARASISPSHPLHAGVVVCPAEFKEVMHSFLSLLLWKSKLLLRGERWMAAHVCDTQMKEAS